jgi:hypothetical protein
MFGSFVVSALALLVAVLGCAWVKPLGAGARRAFDAERHIRDDAPSGR